VSTVIIACKTIMTVTQLLALLITCSALASTSLQAQEHHEGTRLVVMQTNFLPVEQSASRTQYQSDSSVENNNGTELASYRSLPRRLRGMGWTLADGKLTSEERRTEKKPVETRTHGAKGHVHRKHGVVTGAAVSSLASESKSLRPSSGASSMHTHEETSKSHEWTSLVGKMINVVDLNKPPEKYDPPTLNADYHGPKTHPPKHN